MAISCNICVFLVLVLVLFMDVLESLSITGSSTIGINYGQLGNDLPPPKKVAQLLKGLKIKKVKIYDYNPEILQAFANTGIEMWIAIPNGDVAAMTDTQQAMAWLKQNLSPYLPDTKIVGISVGNEIYTGDDAALMTNLVPAMQSLHVALVGMGLDSTVKISSAHSIGVLGNSFPPSAGSVKAELVNYMKPHLEFLALTGAPFWLNAYPFFAYKDNPVNISLDYVLFQPNQGMNDPNTNLHYDNMLHAQMDAVYTAVTAMGYGNLEVRVSETGWPSMGDSDEIGASIKNAARYNRNLLLRLAQNQGTPLRPTASLQAYIFALFNENQKPGPTSERNYGLYKPDGTMVYPVGLGRGSSTNSLSAFTNSAQGGFDHLKSLELRIMILLGLLCFFFLVRAVDK
uniref:glucan endo-1,3-beta-D-glucosidase n=1 Tax=Wollemia nobilis TaxID=56998 RepID=A0A0C9S907_9CONI